MLLRTNCADIWLQYIRALVSLIFSEEHEISDPHFPIGSGKQAYGLRQFQREIGVCILFIDGSRGVAEHSHVKLALRRNIWVILTLVAGSLGSTSCL